MVFVRYNATQIKGGMTADISSALPYLGGCEDAAEKYRTVEMLFYLLYLMRNIPHIVGCGSFLCNNIRGNFTMFCSMRTH